MPQYDIGYVLFFETLSNISANNMSTLSYCKGSSILKPCIGAGKLLLFTCQATLLQELYGREIFWSKYGLFDSKQSFNLLVLVIIILHCKIPIYKKLVVLFQVYYLFLHSSN